ncbi:hypothetical protein RND71_010836 [Anisodus tanguticus]|uniref:Uncharacterized protein n=1 Tax=Anisodus tanguticus TaxID=243964 RepID=A0AAE1SMF3_9SOLA|nr:hypothetical protein RND71_010836 [Anisodus tanguticus]
MRACTRQGNWQAMRRSTIAQGSLTPAKVQWKDLSAASGGGGGGSGSLIAEITSGHIPTPNEAFSIYRALSIMTLKFELKYRLTDNKNIFAILIRLKDVKICFDIYDKYIFKALYFGGVHATWAPRAHIIDMIDQSGLVRRLNERGRLPHEFFGFDQVS